MTAAQILDAEGYARGLAEGEAKGEARGKAEGEAKGKAEGKAELLLRLLSLRFGTLSGATREKVLRARPEHVDVWVERVLTAASVEEVLG